MKKKSIYCLNLAVLAMVFMIVGRANAQATDCFVEAAIPPDPLVFLTIRCGPSDNVIDVFVEDVASGDTLVPSVFVDIGDGEGPINYGPASDLEIVTVEALGGSNDVSIFDLDVGILSVQVVTGSGRDKVSVGPNVILEEVLSIETGDGADAVTLGLNVVANIRVEVSTDRGADVVTTVAAVPLGIGGVAGRNITIDGGGRAFIPVTDTIVIGDGSLVAVRPVQILGFESFGGTGSGD